MRCFSHWKSYIQTVLTRCTVVVALQSTDAPSDDVSLADMCTELLEVAQLASRYYLSIALGVIQVTFDSCTAAASAEAPAATETTASASTESQQTAIDARDEVCDKELYVSNSESVTKAVTFEESFENAAQGEAAADVKTDQTQASAAATPTGPAEVRGCP